MANGQSLYQVANGIDPLAPLPAPEAPQMSRGQLIAGILADALAGAAGQTPRFAQMLGQQRQQAQEDVRWGRRLEQQEQIRSRYRDPPAPHYFETNNGSVGVIGPDGQPRVIYNDPTPKMNFIPDGMGGGQWVTVPSQAPTDRPAIGAVVPDPRQGGAGGNVSGGFPRY